MKGFAYIALAWALASGCPAQEDKPETAVVEPAARSRTMRVVAVGDAPPFRQEVRDGVRRELPPPPGSIPPRQLTVTLASEEGESPCGELKVQLGQVSGGVPVRSGAIDLTLRDSSVPWVKVKAPEDGDFLVVLWRDRGAVTWDKARVMVVPESAGAGSVVFINVAPGPVAMVFGGEKIALPPRLPLAKPLPPGKAAEFQLGVPDGAAKFKRITAMSLEQQPQERTMVVISQSDAKESRQPVKMTLLRDFVIVKQ